MQNQVLFFPGQGSQFVGMGKEFYEKYSFVKDIYQQANDILGYDIKTLSFEGSESELTNTKNAQPAIVIYQYILLSLLKEKGIKPSVVAGHSLGEFSALLAAEMLSFEDVLKIVQQRGAFMDAADPEQKGTMAVVLGLDDDTIIATCKEVSATSYVEPVNFNTPAQVVISGYKEGISLATEQLLANGAKRVLPLAVSGAFHSKLMHEAADKFSEYINQFTFNKPQCTIISNVTAESYDEGVVKALLPLQMKSPVQWVKTVQNIVKGGYTNGIEVSTGTVIQGMVKKICPEFTFTSLSDIIN